MFYNYPIHYLYDFLTISVILLMGKQMFNLRLKPTYMLAFIMWMMVLYQLNFYVIIPYLPREFKYVTLYLGLYFGFHNIIGLKTVGALIVITVTSAMNGIFTNINLIFMLKFLFPNYGIALEAQHLQYTCYVVSVVILATLLRVFNVKIFDLQRYL